MPWTWQISSSELVATALLLGGFENSNLKAIDPPISEVDIVSVEPPLPQADAKNTHTKTVEISRFRLFDQILRAEFIT
jgi:hypothetical protein